MDDHTTNDSAQEIPYGYCHCGCGRKTNIAHQSSTEKGWIRGQPRKFIRGHRQRLGLYQSPEDAFWRNVTPGEPEQCWEWRGALNGDGYGLAQWVGASKRWRAHRLSYYLHFGSIPANLQVLHKCDNPQCVNPGHLFLSADGRKWVFATRNRKSVRDQSFSCFQYRKQEGLEAYRVD
jgi:hypothetical protein